MSRPDVTARPMRAPWGLLLVCGIFLVGGLTAFAIIPTGDVSPVLANILASTSTNTLAPSATWTSSIASTRVPTLTMAKATATSTASKTVVKT
ncbi:MAG: hypothetical protein AB1817_01260, partial [Chloroflexota bacterium]